MFLTLFQIVEGSVYLLVGALMKDIGAEGHGFDS